jgi:glucan phosphoethanolaminetransferase (alkaline phosphatase superfamily)
MRTFGLHMDGMDDDTREAKLKRATLGAFYGFLAGVGFVFIAAYIDIWLNPDLPFGVDWSMFMTRILAIALGLALVGAVTCWWNEGWTGLFSGALASSALALIGSLVTSTAETSMKVIVLIFSLLPLAVMTLPIAWVLRRLTERHAVALQLKRGYVRIAGLIIIALVLGAGSGYFMKTFTRGLDVARFMQGTLQNLSQEANPLSSITGMTEHQAMPYKLFQQKSQTSTEGFDVRVEYQDGFELRCVIVAYPGSTPYVSSCESNR